MKDPIQCLVLVVKAAWDRYHYHKLAIQSFEWSGCALCMRASDNVPRIHVYWLIQSSMYTAKRYIQL